MKAGILAAIAAAGLTGVLAASAWAQSLPLPSGSYSRTCTDARALSQAGGRLLIARCQKADGSYESASLRYETCRGDIGNSNGQLTCAANGDPAQPEPARGEITLFSQLGYAGRSAVIDRPAATLGAWEMADKARSLQVGSGRWQLCSEPNFRGRCVTVDSNERDLRTMGLDGQISSVQPIR